MIFEIVQASVTEVQIIFNCFEQVSIDVKNLLFYAGFILCGKSVF